MRLHAGAVKAIRQYEFGPPEVLLYEDVADPEPSAGQVRVAVEAAGVHLIDTKIRQGAAFGTPLPDLPMTPGREIAGTVDELGSDVDRSWLGRRVVGHLGMASGGYAEMAVIDAAAVHEIGDSVSASAAVASIGTGRTALVILDAATLTAADVVVVTAAAGGIGSLLLQFAARQVGATVVGLARGSEKVRVVRELGADVAMDYTESGWAEQVATALGGRPVSVVLDGVGGAILDQTTDLLGSAGRIVSFGWASGGPSRLDEAALADRGITQSWVVGPKAPPMGDIRILETRSLDLTSAGGWVPLLNPPYELSDAASAHAAVENRRTIGKVILRP